MYHNIFLKLLENLRKIAKKFSNKNIVNVLRKLTKLLRKLFKTFLTKKCFLQAVMNSQYGLDYIIQQEDAADLLLVTLQSECPQVKKVMFEMLAAMCLYKGAGENAGRALVIDTLELLVSTTNQPVSEFLVSEIDATPDEPFSIAHSTAIFKLVNCLILSLPELSVRKLFRQTFIEDGLDHKLTILRNISDPGTLPILKIHLNYFPSILQLFFLI